MVEPRSPLRLPAEPLTPKEREVLDFLLGGLSDGEIAKKLAVSAATVARRIHAVECKFAARNRVHLVLIASAWLPMPVIARADAPGRVK